MENCKNTTHAGVEEEYNEVTQVLQPHTVPGEEAVVVSLKYAFTAEFTVVAPRRAPPVTG